MAAPFWHPRDSPPCGQVEDVKRRRPRRRIIRRARLAARLATLTAAVDAATTPEELERIRAELEAARREAARLEEGA